MQRELSRKRRSDGMVAPRDGHCKFSQSVFLDQNRGLVSRTPAPQNLLDQPRARRLGVYTFRHDSTRSSFWCRPRAGTGGRRHVHVRAAGRGQPRDQADGRCDGESPPLVCQIRCTRSAAPWRRSRNSRCRATRRRRASAAIKQEREGLGTWSPGDLGPEGLGSLRRQALKPSSPQAL